MSTYHAFKSDNLADLSTPKGGSCECVKDQLYALKGYAAITFLIKPRLQTGHVNKGANRAMLNWAIGSKTDPRTILPLYSHCSNWAKRVLHISTIRPH
ncbi:hypothetical protein VNO77_34392 [Canavalia gladiata]|uniref:Uncharacterized protein n=1 Tax=Canavalia gladiata TaxID=3824 RepID=A0AAN9PZR6_CANGL